jgi:FtsZ-interacting cell division protein ZipA
MNNLRWILLAGGAALVLALLIVGLVRGRQAARASERRDLRRLDEPTLGELPEVAASASIGETPVPVSASNDDARGLAQAAPATAPVERSQAADAIAAVADERPTIAEWPPADQRVIISLRIVSVNQDRLSGRRLRQGLLSAGFLHGELAIFHLPGQPDRAMLSAANLSQPGQLDPALMDYQRFAGLHVFTVLPGRVAPAMALEQLYAVTAEVARRVDGRVLDETGQPLDPTRVDGWRYRHLQQSPAAPGGASAAAAG